MNDIARLAGDVLCVGLPGDALTSDVAGRLRELRPGAIVLFARNVTTRDATRALVADARAAAGGAAPALACVDQEGGRVARLTFAPVAMPSMMALGATDDPALAERAGMRLADELAEIGANVDFAPVLDLALAASSTVIGTRSLGDDPHRVAVLGAALVRGLLARGVASVPKHFPGHGATGVDSHRDLPVLGAGADDLRARDLLPFRAAFEAGAPAVMTAHVALRGPDARPATLSPHVLGTLLRDELGFAGVCFTDCLEMAAIAHGAGTVRAAVAALAAGADALTFSHDLDLARAARDAIVAAVAAGSLAFERLASAAARVRAMRRAFAPRAMPPPRPDDAIAEEIAHRSIALAAGVARLDAGVAVTVVSFEGEAGDGIAGATGERPSLSLALRRRRVRSESMRVPLDPDPAMIAHLSDLIAMQGARDVAIVARRAHLVPAQAAAIADVLRVAPHAIAISAREPFDVPLLRGARGVLCSFGDEASSIEALADVLTGRTVPGGRLPVALATPK